MSKKISLGMLKILLTPKEMNNVLGGSVGANCSVKCTNDTTSFWVRRCPSSSSESAELCFSYYGSYGTVVSCAGPAEYCNI